MPDVVGFADYVAAADELIPNLKRAPDVDPLFLLPCPDGPKVRDLAVLTCPDLVVYSAAAASVAATTDSMLSRDVVFSCRLQKGPPKWQLHQFGAWWPKFRESAVALLRSGECRAMRQEDVQRFFPSVRVEILVNFLKTCECEKRSVAMVERMLRAWQSDSALPGLPIGPDASRLLANALLLPVDLAIVDAGADLRRWLDDMLVFALMLAGCDEAVEAGSAALAKLGLQFSPTKSQSFDDPVKAIAHIQDRLLDSLHALHQVPDRRDEAIAAFEAAFEDLHGTSAAERSQKHFRYLLNRMTKSGNRFAVPLLAGDVELANLDPATTGRYLLAVGPAKGSARDDLFNQLTGRPPNSFDAFDALDLHIVRALVDSQEARHSRPRFGIAEGRVFGAIAQNTSRRAPVRAWAWKAWGESSTWTAREGAEAAEAETDQHVRRAGVVPFCGRPSIHRWRLLRHLRARHPELSYSTKWVEAA